MPRLRPSDEEFVPRGNKTFAPKYVIVEETIREEIEERLIEVGAKVPSESKLMERFQVSRATVRHALANLEAEGLIVRSQGVGTFVQQKPVQLPQWRLQSFADEARSAGRHPSTTVNCHRDADVYGRQASRLGVPEGTTAMYLDRSHKADDEVVSWDRTWIVEPWRSRLTETAWDGVDLYAALASLQVGLELHADRSVRGAGASEEAAAVFGVSVGTPTLLVERLTTTGTGDAVDYQIRYYKGERFALGLHTSNVAP